MVLASSGVVLVASSVLANMGPHLMANMVSNLMANMMPHLVASVVASVMTLSISWISSEHMARLDWCHMGTIGITLAICSSLDISKAKGAAYGQGYMQLPGHFQSQV